MLKSKRIELVEKNRYEEVIDYVLTEIYSMIEYKEKLAEESIMKNIHHHIGKQFDRQIRISLKELVSVGFLTEESAQNYKVVGKTPSFRNLNEIAQRLNKKWK